jgi:1-acyl-sn-glycerol-3-phosphate acyltransferase
MGSTALRLVRIALYLAFTGALMPVQAAGLGLRRRWVCSLPVFYHRCCCRILGLAVRRIGTPESGPSILFVSNHVSYIDITVLGSLIKGSFIAKAEVARWPLFGWLAKLQRSVFIDRRIRSTATQRAAVAARLAAGGALILFAEGTSGDGNRVLPFKTALFAAAEVEGRARAVTVQPVSIAYARLDGLPIGRSWRPFFAWYGSMTLAPHLWTMLGLGVVEVVVEFHPPTTLAQCGSRKALASYCRGRIAGGMAAALAGRPQPMPEAPPATAIPVEAIAAAAE